jgi:hypothetical protein
VDSARRGFVSVQSFVLYWSRVSKISEKLLPYKTSFAYEVVTVTGFRPSGSAGKPTITQSPGTGVVTSTPDVDTAR